MREHPDGPPLPRHPLSSDGSTFVWKARRFGQGHGPGRSGFGALILSMTKAKTACAKRPACGGSPVGLRAKPYNVSDDDAQSADCCFFQTGCWSSSHRTASGILAAIQAAHHRDCDCRSGCGPSDCRGGAGLNSCRPSSTSGGGGDCGACRKGKPEARTSVRLRL